METIHATESGISLKFISEMKLALQGHLKLLTTLYRESQEKHENNLYTNYKPPAYKFYIIMESKVFHFLFNFISNMVHNFKRLKNMSTP